MEISLSSNVKMFITDCVDQIIYKLPPMQPERATENLIGQQPSPEWLSQRLELEGQCKISKCYFLEFSLLKSILLLIPLAVSVVGLLFLKYYKSLRAKVFYFNSSAKEATHIYIQGVSKREEEIVLLNKNDKGYYFYYKKLKYQLIEEKPFPFGFDYETDIKQRLTEQHLREGLTTAEVQANMATFGKNEHIVDPPSYPQYLYEVMTEPFFFIQYLAAVIYIIEKMPELSILLIGASIITTSINYIILYISYRKIKAIAEVVVNVFVLRNGEFQQLPSSQLVPGDIFIPKDELFCDVLLLKGEVYVNEANLTGESIPIGKFGLQEYKYYRAGDNSRWIFEGSKILSSQNPLALVVHTGYSSKRGRILRKILNRKAEVPHFFTTYLYFLVEIFAVGVVVYCSTMFLRVNKDNLQGIIILLNFLLIVTFCFPPSSPIYFNLVYSFSLLRLKWNNILGTEPQKTVEGAHIRMMCFDKTGTLTEDKVEVHRVINFQKDTFSEIKIEDNGKSLDFKLFASCHTVKEFNGQLMGDEIDLKTFLHSGYKLYYSSQSSVCFQVEQKQCENPNHIQILKIYQYESRFQSMSVVVFDVQSGRHYAFVKGAPQIIHKYSTVKYSYFDNLLQTESYGGFRTIGYGFKQIDASNLEATMKGSRESHLEGITMLGMLVFENKLKPDASETITRLSLADIRSRMITGDNIYIAIETAMRCGILERREEVIVLEGNRQQLSPDVAEADVTFAAKLLRFQQEEVNVREEIMTFHNYMDSHLSIIIDNDFLKLTQHLPLSHHIKVFSRISPENKALIVRRIIGEITRKRKQMRWLDRLISEQVDKVGMVGDGANDLLAIKEANIGIGIRNCDSSYAASFSIQNLMDIDYIIREAKCSEREIIEICRFMSVNSFLMIPMIIIMETEASFFSSTQLIFDNFTKFLLFPILLALSRPAAQQTPHKPASNFLKRQNQLIVWGNNIISSIAIGATVLYFRSTSQYITNNSRADMNSGWASNDYLVASEYLYYSLQPVVIIACLYESTPWKDPLYRNIPLFIVFLLNFAFQTGYYFLQPQLAGFFGLPAISYTSLAYLFAIGMGASVVNFIYCKIINALRLHEQRAPACLQGKDVVELAQTGSSSDNQRS